MNYTPLPPPAGPDKRSTVKWSSSLSKSRKIVKFPSRENYWFGSRRMSETCVSDRPLLSIFSSNDIIAANSPRLDSIFSRWRRTLNFWTHVSSGSRGEKTLERGVRTGVRFRATSISIAAALSFFFLLSFLSGKFPNDRETRVTLGVSV